MMQKTLGCHIVGRLIARLEADESSKRTVGPIIKAWRLEHNIGLRRMARVVNLTPSNLCTIEAGRRSVGHDILKRIHKFMKEIEDERKQGYS